MPSTAARSTRSHGKGILIETKDDLRKRIGRSSDTGYALAKVSDPTRSRDFFCFDLNQHRRVGKVSNIQRRNQIST